MEAPGFTNHSFGLQDRLPFCVSETKSALRTDTRSSVSPALILADKFNEAKTKRRKSNNPTENQTEQNGKALMQCTSVNGCGETTTNKHAKWPVLATKIDNIRASITVVSKTRDSETASRHHKKSAENLKTQPTNNKPKWGGRWHGGSLKHKSKMLERRVPEIPWDSSYQFLEILNMGSVSFKKHGMEIWEFSTQLKELEQLKAIVYFQLEESPHPSPFQFPTLHQPPPHKTPVINPLNIY